MATTLNNPTADTPRVSHIAFPEDALVGSLGEYARLMADDSEVPPEFYFACGLTMVVSPERISNCCLTAKWNLAYTRSSSASLSRERSLLR